MIFLAFKIPVKHFILLSFHDLCLIVTGQDIYNTRINGDIYAWTASYCSILCCKDNTDKRVASPSFPKMPPGRRSRNFCRIERMGITNNCFKLLCALKKYDEMKHCFVKLVSQKPSGCKTMRTSAPTDKPDFDLHVLVHSVNFLTNHGIKMAQTNVHVHRCLLQMKNKSKNFFFS